MAYQGKISWREAARRLELTHGRGLKNHMERHFEHPDRPMPPPDPEDLFDDEILAACNELLAQVGSMPLEVRPLVLTAVHNLRNLQETRPSQKDLVASLKAVYEVTGMKIGQQMLLQFAAAAFPGGAAAPPPPALQNTQSQAYILPTSDDEDIEEAELVAVDGAT